MNKAKHVGDSVDADGSASHPVETGLGAAGAALAGAAIGSVAGPVGVAIGAAVGAITGAIAGHAVAENLNPTRQDFSRVTLPYPPASSADTPYDEPAPETALQLDQQTIAVRAYDIWERKGRTDGHMLDDWLQAETSLQTGRLL